MRFTLAVAASGAAQLVLYFLNVITISAIAYVLLAALGAGFFARQRGWLAGALSVLLGATLYGVATLAGPNAAGQTILDMLQSETALLAGVLPYAILGALSGMAGEWLRSRALAFRR